jgi:arylsulfatase A-like enzyme
VAASLCALQLVHAEWDREATTNTAFAARLLAPIGLCLLLLGLVVKTTTLPRSFESIARGSSLLSALLALWIGFWVNLNADTPLQQLFGDRPVAANTSRPNFLLIVLDTVRADHLDLFGYERETMPNLKRFAQQEAQSVIRTFTTGSWTLPSHASMFTGLYPSAHGAHYPFVTDKKPGFLAYSIREDVPTLAEFLTGLGYQTAGIAANFGMLSQFGIPRGFHDYSASPGPAYFAPRVAWLYRAHLGDQSFGKFLRSSFSVGLRNSRMFSAREPNYRRAWEINILARQWLERHGDRPFFLFLNYMDAHDPYLPIAEDDERFVKRPAEEEWLGFPRERYDASMWGGARFSAQEIEFLKGQYDAGLVSLDRELGRLFEYLRTSGYFENTLIFITTDHGEAFFEHGFPEHGNSLYQPEIDSFFMIKVPPSLGQIKPSAYMQSVDLFPTFAAVLNEPPPGQMQGLPWGSGREYALAEVFCKSCGAESIGSVKWPDDLRRDLVAVMIGNQKLIRSTHGPDEVYDVSIDPGELNPSPDPDPNFLERAEELIAERQRGMAQDLSKYPEDKRLLEKLRSLGYVQ